MQLLQGFGVWKEADDTEVHGKNSDEPEVARAPLSSIWKTLDMPLSAVAGVSRRQCHSRVQAAVPRCLRQGGYEGRSSVIGSITETIRVTTRAQVEWGSSPGENVPEKGSGWSGRGSPLFVGPKLYRAGSRSRRLDAGAVEDRRYPEDPVWSEVARRYMDYAEKAGTPELLTSSALWEGFVLPFPSF